MANTLRTPLVRLAFPELFEAKVRKDAQAGAKPQFSAMFLFDKAAQETPQYQALIAEIEATIKEKWPKTLPKNFKHPVKKGDQLKNAEGEYYAGCDDTTVAMNANSQFAPEVLNRQKVILSKGKGDNEIYAGCWVYATVTPFAFDTQGNNGVKLYLGNVMKMRDDKNLGGRKSAKTEFEDIEIEETSEELETAAEDWLS